MTVETLRPNAVGDSSALTPFGAAANWDCCDETPSDNDTSYVYSSDFDANPYLDLYNLVNTAIPAGSTINSVTVKANIKSILTAAKATFRIALKKSGGATQYGSFQTPPTSYTVCSQVFAGVALSDLNDLQVGIEITSRYYGPWDTYLHGRCTQVWVEIDYTLAGVAKQIIMDGFILVT